MTLQITGRHVTPAVFDGIEYQRVAGVFVRDEIELIRTSEFGVIRDWFNGLEHSGSDLAGWLGLEGYWTTNDALVLFSGYSWAGFGNTLVVITEDDEGMRWLIGIAHLRDRPLVARGETLRRGQLFGYMGETGSATGPHWHIWIARALDYDHAPGVSETDEEGDYAEFWSSPRGASESATDKGVSRLHDVIDFLTEDLDPDLLPLWSPLPPRDRAAGAPSLVTTTRDTSVETFEATAHADGITSLWAVSDGALIGFTVGAPAFVNQGFVEAVDDDDLGIGWVIPAGTILIAVS